MFLTCFSAARCVIASAREQVPLPEQEAERYEGGKDEDWGQLGRRGRHPDSDAWTAFDSFFDRRLRLTESALVKDVPLRRLDEPPDCLRGTLRAVVRLGQTLAPEDALIGGCEPDEHSLHSRHAPERCPQQ
jgi:hypothetical protein